MGREGAASTCIDPGEPRPSRPPSRPECLRLLRGAAASGQRCAGVEPRAEQRSSRAIPRDADGRRMSSPDQVAGVRPQAAVSITVPPRRLPTQVGGGLAYETSSPVCLRAPAGSSARLYADLRADRVRADRVRPDDAAFSASQIADQLVCAAVDGPERLLQRPGCQPHGCSVLGAALTPFPTAGQ
jgi:hypothetical protein